MISISPRVARRLAIMSQQLANVAPGNGKEGLLALIRKLGCLQIDPINVVARSPLLVLWSRLGAYDLADLEALLWQDKDLFEYWAHAASIVLSEDYPLFQPRMRNFARGHSRWEKRVLDWIAQNETFRQFVLQELGQRGPLFPDQIESPPDIVPWQSSGWTDSRNVSVMLTFLWEQGEITVVRRHGKGFGLKKQWALIEHHLPQWENHEPWTEHEVVYQAVQKSLLALGVGTAEHIRNHFIRGCYPNLDMALARLESEDRIVQADIVSKSGVWPGPWYIHADAIPMLEKLLAGVWEPRTTLLSPFDNLICDRGRTETLFNFRYRSEIYTPKAKRKYGYYVMPVLHGDRLVGRIDPKIDRKKRKLLINAIHWEPDMPESAEMERSVTTAIEDLSAFLGAIDIQYQSD